MRDFKYILFVILTTCLFTSCGSTYKYVNTLQAYCMRSNSSWEKWENPRGFMQTQLNYSNAQYIITIYSKYEQTSKYLYQITMDLFSGTPSSNGMTEYSGYMEFNGKTTPCTILCDKKMQKAISKHGLKGTINVLFANNILGVGFNWN